MNATITAESLGSEEFRRAHGVQGKISAEGVALVLVPAMTTLRDQVMAKHGFAQRIRVGAAGELGTILRPHQPPGRAGPVPRAAPP